MTMQARTTMLNRAASTATLGVVDRGRFPVARHARHSSGVRTLACHTSPMPSQPAHGAVAGEMNQNGDGNIGVMTMSPARRSAPQFVRGGARSVRHAPILLLAPPSYIGSPCRFLEWHAKRRTR